MPCFPPRRRTSRSTTAPASPWRRLRFRDAAGCVTLCAARAGAARVPSKEPSGGEGVELRSRTRAHVAVPHTRSRVHGPHQGASSPRPCAHVLLPSADAIPAAPVYADTAAAPFSAPTGGMDAVPSDGALDMASGAPATDMLGGAPPAFGIAAGGGSSEWHPEPEAAPTAGVMETSSSASNVVPAAAPGPGNMQLALSPADQARQERERRAAAAAAERERFLAEVRAKWKERNEAALAERQEHEANEKRNVVEEAEAEKQLFYNQRTKAIESTMSSHRAQQQRDAAIASGSAGSVWERMATIVEQAELGKSKTDLTKFKSLLTRLKTQPPAATPPAATGVKA